jgi:RNA polymerase sigma-70 factor (ECF subfamily)
MEHGNVSGERAKSGLFSATRWSLVLTAGRGPSPEAQKAMEELCHAYWYPLYAHIRGRGQGAEDAQDLTQGFIASLIARTSLSRVSPENGRFRTYLLNALKYFLADQHARENALRRGGGVRPLALDALTPEARYAMEPATEESPERLFDRRWAAALMERVFARLGAEMEAEGKAGQFEILHHFLGGEPDPGEYATAAGQLGSSPNAVAQQVRRLRQRCRKLAIEEACETVGTPAEAEAELRALFA